jgi:hypothetical protein
LSENQYISSRFFGYVDVIHNCAISSRRRKKKGWKANFGTGFPFLGNIGPGSITMRRIAGKGLHQLHLAPFTRSKKAVKV